MSLLTRLLPRRTPPPAQKIAGPVGYYLSPRGDLEPLATKAGNFTGDIFQARSITPDEEGFATAYIASVWAYRCTLVRAQAVSRVPCRVVNRAGKEIPDHPLIQAIKDNRSLLRRWEWSLCIWGETFIEKARNRYGYARGLRWLNPLGITVDTSYGRINNFHYSPINGGRFVKYEPDEMVFSRYDNPLDDLRGLSPFLTVFDELGIDRHLSRVLRSYYANDTRVGMLLIPDHDLLDADQEKFMAWWKANYQGSKNAGKPALMPYSLRAERVQNQPNEDDTRIRESIKQEICAAFGVPPILVGTGDVATYQNTDAQMRFFSENLVMPECEFIASDINVQAMSFFDNSGDAIFEFDYDEILALSDNMLRKTDMQNSRLAAGGITLNEWRKQIGEKPIPTGNVFFVPSGVIPVRAEDLGKPLPTTSQPASPFGLPQLPPERPTPTPQLPAPKPEVPAQLSAKRVLTPIKKENPLVDELRESLHDALAGKTHPIEELFTEDPPGSAKVETQTIAPMDTDAIRAGYLAELDAWERKAINKGAAKAAGFVCEALPDFYGDAIRTRLADLPATAERAESRAIFKAVKQAFDVTPDDALAYWARYDRLMNDIGNAWLDDYMSQVADAVIPILTPDLVDEQLNGALALYHDDLFAALSGTPDAPGPLAQLALAGLAAGQEAIDRNRTIRPPGKALDLGIDWYLLSQDAFDFLRDYMFGLVSRLDDTTREQLRATLQTWMASGEGVDKLKDSVEQIFRNPVRARLIAQTESSRVFNEGAFRSMERAGVQEADWLTVSASDIHICPLCRALGSDEFKRAPIKIGWTYQGQTYRPPAHPDCRCFTRPVL